MPAAVTTGDTVSGEVIDLPGDIDEFVFSGAPGAEFNVFFQFQQANATPPSALFLDVIANDQLQRSIQGNAGAGLLDSPSGRFSLPAGGTYRLRVSGGTGQAPWPYRFFVYPVNPRPESRPDTLAFGDSVSGEAIDLPGDVDEFRVSVSDSSGANLVVQLGPDASNTTLSAQLINAAIGQPVAQVYTFAPGAYGLSGRMALGPGSYTVRVEGADFGSYSLLRGSYRVWLYRFRFGPEVARDTIAIGDTVSGESLEPLGDADAFHFFGVKGQHVNVALQGLGGPASGGMQAFLSSPRPGPDPLAVIGSPMSTAALHDRQTLRLDLPATGWYNIGVSGGDGVFDHGLYRLAVEPVGTAPEQVSDALVPGDSVTTESIEAPGDWDQFAVTATPGQELGIVFQSTGTTSYPWVLAFDPTSGDSLATTVGQFVRFAGPFTVPASGHVAIAVFDRPTVGFRECYDAVCNGVFRFVGGYQFRVTSINRAPENVPAPYSVGDTVRGEAIAPAGDLDEFTSSATPGETLGPWYRLTANPQPAGGLITLEVIDPATGSVLVGRGVSLFAASTAYYSPGNFIVPPGGAFLIRVRGSGTFGDEVTTAAYEFFIKRGP